jgi:hypothetical protein
MDPTSTKRMKTLATFSAPNYLRTLYLVFENKQMIFHVVMDGKIFFARFEEVIMTPERRASATTPHGLLNTLNGSAFMQEIESATY